MEQIIPPNTCGIEAVIYACTYLGGYLGREFEGLIGGDENREDNLLVIGKGVGLLGSLNWRGIRILENIRRTTVDGLLLGINVNSLGFNLEGTVFATFYIRIMR